MDDDPDSDATTTTNQGFYYDTESRSTIKHTLELLNHTLGWQGEQRPDGRSRIQTTICVIVTVIINILKAIGKTWNIQNKGDHNKHFDILNVEK